VDPLDVPFGGHRLPMLEALLNQRFAEWHDRLAIFGDWLEDCDSPERFVARAAWSVAGMPKAKDRKVWLLSLCVRVERHIYMRRDAVNEGWLLGFAPATLRLKWFHSQSLTAGFTWNPTRTPGQYQGTDKGKFVWMFTPQPEPAPGLAGSWFPE
jgi:hypothetical protein